MSTSVSLAPFVAPALQFAGIVVAGVFAAVATKLVTFLNGRLHLQLTDQQVQTVHDAAGTAAGVINTMLTRGVLKHEDVHVSSPQVLAAVQTAMTMVPQAAASLGVTPEGMAHMVVSRVDHWALAPTVAVATPAAAAPPVPATP